MDRTILNEAQNPINITKKKNQKFNKKRKLQINLRQNNARCGDAEMQLYNSLWDYTQENICVEDAIEWISNRNEERFPTKLDQMHPWVIKGPPKLSISDETHFCDPLILRQILCAKEIFEELDIKELSKARCRANSFEAIRSAFFMNRAALKMANIDAATGFIFTDIDRNLHHCKKKGPYYFADVCAGPGGFSEYILWRKKWLFKGFGFTLKCDHDFELSHSQCVSPVTFNAQYGFHGDGDIFRLENIKHFAQNILHESDGLGVHFMMSDGGFSVEGNENLQEILSKQLYVCQCLMALEIVRCNGHFVTKLFDLFTPFSVGLIFLMYKCFEKITILKPNASRPANSERYLVCYGLQQTSQMQIIRRYLSSIAGELWEMREVQKNTSVDINEIVPMSLLKADEDFCKFLTKSNNKIGKNQAIGLQKLGIFCRNPALVEPSQGDLRVQSLKFWRIPDKPKIPMPRFTTDDLLKVAVRCSEFMDTPPTKATDYCELRQLLQNSKDWHYTLSGCNKKSNICNFYAGVGDSRVYRLQCSKWVKVKKLQLIRGTLIYGEMIKEKIIKSTNEEVKETTKQCLHVIDALRLGETSLADLPFTERVDLIDTYCQAVNHESRFDHIRVRAKPVQQLCTLVSLHSVLVSKTNECNYSELPKLGYDSVQEGYDVNSVLFLNSDKEQSFNTTFTTRIQAFFCKNGEQDNETFKNTITLSSLIEAIGDAK